MINTTYIPNELKQHATWACYDDSKLLVSALSGVSFLPSDYLQLTTFDVAYKYMADHNKRVKGLAFILPDTYLMVDIPTRNKDIVDDFLGKLDTYAEYSPNKESVHIILKATFDKKSKVDLASGISIYTKGQYVCMSGDIVNYGTNYINHEATNTLATLYDKYFLGIVKQESKYIFSKTNTQAQKITQEIVENRINLSPANKLFYQLKSGSYRQAGFNEQLDAIRALFNILIFFTGGDKELTYEMVRGSSTYTKELENKQGEHSLLDIIYKNAILDQTIVFDADKYDAQDYVFDENTGTTKFFANYSLDDTGNAKRIFDRYHDIIRYDENAGVFYQYNATLGIWEQDSKDNVKLKKLVDNIIEDMRIEIKSPRITNDQNLLKCYLKNISYISSSGGKRNAIEELKHLHEINISHALFDKDNFLLNTLSGVVNLRNGQLLEHSPDFYMTKSTRCLIDTQNKPELFLKFIDETCCYNEQLKEYLRKALGYSLTGSNVEQCYFLMYGDGNNGKSVLMNIIGECLGDYATHCSIKVFLEQRFTDSSKATPEIARLEGARMVITSEPKESSKIDENMIKDFTGGEPIYARHLHQNGYNFRPIGKLWISCNNLLKITGTTRGDWRRPKVIEFKNDVPEEKIDKYLFDKLKNETAQILGYYLLRGCLDYLEIGSLQEPEIIRSAIREYRTESNSVLAWATNYTTRTNTFTPTPANQFFIAYLKWAKQTHENDTISANGFARELKKAFTFLYGDKVEKITAYNNKLCYRGVQILQDDTNYSFTNDDVYGED